MHELSVAMSILELAEAESARHNHAKVEAVHIRLGKLAGVMKDALLGAFELAREQSASCRTCRLIIEDVPIIVFCQACQAQREVVNEMRCIACGELCGELRQGREMEITAMEITQ